MVCACLTTSSPESLSCCLKGGYLTEEFIWGGGAAKKFTNIGSSRKDKEKAMSNQLRNNQGAGGRGWGGAHESPNYCGTPGPI